MEPNSETLQGRVERLERAGLRDRAILFGVIILACVTAQAPSPHPAQTFQTPVTVKSATGSATLTASGLTLRDATGKERMFVGIDDEGRPSVDLRDPSGTLRESLYLFKQTQPTLRLFDANNKRRLELRLSENGNPEVQISDPNEKLRGAFFIGTTGNPQIALYGTDEKLRGYFATDDIMAYLVMRDGAATNRVNIGGFTDGSVGMDIRNTANSVLWKVP